MDTHGQHDVDAEYELAELGRNMLYFYCRPNYVYIYAELCLKFRRTLVLKYSVFIV